MKCFSFLPKWTLYFLSYLTGENYFLIIDYMFKSLKNKEDTFRISRKIASQAIYNVISALRS